MNSENDIITMKYNSNGDQQWVNRYSRFPNSSDVATCMTTNSSGNVIVAGFNSGDFVTIMYDSLGLQQWASFYDGPSNNTESVQSVVCDNFGNTYITGHSVEIGQFFDYVSIKYNSNGLEKWIARYTGPGDRNDYSSDLALDQFGNVYVTGRSVNEFGNSDFLTVKYSQTVGISSQSNSISSVYKLDQNYPNPFNPNTKINFSIPNTQYARLFVYDILGNEIVKLVDENLQPGSYIIEFNGTNFPSGVYYYGLVVDSFGETDNFNEVKKMILLK